ncbi:adenosylcobinamide-GDP ribazoletransferase [Paracoccus sp. PAR01]|uniref:adenosylcobinamide-GDP ribazoletransferase n=1 Tax=Paracoccus sp. PAR01 TaxID=2769282 RepID=UPI00177FD2B6|nr:adenosylcobinamide-GDP ribazoletransferase [Paracoccus sp. PAR01]MBD9527876.1 adenosylcobinamide-GDP ribazoletransferase [Paracoccus sp. PAR01]
MARLWPQAVTALVWLTRLPLGRFLPQPPVPLSQAAWAFPVAGLAIGTAAAAVLLLADALGLSAAIAAILAIGVQVWLTGGLHEDGLADYADGCGGATRARSLEIMRDSRIGSYGVLALLLVLGLRAACLTQLTGLTPILAAIALIGAAMLSRAGMSVALAMMPPAREDGLGRAAGRPSGKAAVSAVALSFIPLFIFTISGIIPFAAAVSPPLACLGAQALLARQAHRRLGGQTGDVLGALQQTGELATLLALLVAALPHAA